MTDEGSGPDVCGVLQAISRYVFTPHLMPLHCPVYQMGSDAAKPRVRRVASQCGLVSLFQANLCLIGQCSGEQPCSNCGKKKLSCSYNTSASANKPVVFVKTGKHSTVNTVAFKRTIPAPVAGPGVDDTCYFYCFEVFSRRNNITGKKEHFADDVKHLSGSHAAQFFLDSLRALGALQAAKLLPREDARRRNHVYSSVVFYAKAVASLRESLEMSQDTMSDSKRTTLLWTTLFLGMYEVCTESFSWLR